MLRTSAARARGRAHIRLGLMILVVGASLVACAPTPSPAPAAQSGAPSGGQPSGQRAASAPKTLVVGQGFEIGGLNRVGRNDAEIGHVINAGLVTRDPEK